MSYFSVKKMTGRMGSLLLCCLLCCCTTFSQTPVIFDSDMGPDYDDVGAITLLHAFADSGKIKILATMASDKYEGVAAVLDLFNTYFNRPEIPIGVPKGDAVDQRDWQHWTDTILAKYPHTIVRNSEAADAVTLYRKILAGQKDHSVVIITVGFLTNLSGLLRSGPDSNSSLNGEELVSRKVKELVSMAGGFPAGHEFNVHRDSKASQYVFGHWPGNVIFSGFEIGKKIKCGLPLVHNTAIRKSPVQDVFRISIPMAAEDSAGRMSWDETAVLVGSGGVQPYYKLQAGRIRVAEDGSNTWDSSGKGQSYLVESVPPIVVRDVIDRLIMHQPAPHRSATQKPGLASRAAGGPSPEKVHRILFLGNSITYDGRYIVDLETYFTLHYPDWRFEFINEGLPSETVSGLSEPGHADGKFPRPDLHERLTRVLKLTKPDLAFVGYGMNDGIYMPFDDRRFAKFRKGMVWLHKELAKSGIPIIHLTPAVFDEQRGGHSGYADVMDRYAGWLLQQRDSLGWSVGDIYFPMKKYLLDRRSIDPAFAFAKDGVHPDSLGHWIIAKAILNFLGEQENATSAVAAFEKYPHGLSIFRLIGEKQSMMKDAWLTAAGHKRPGMNAGLPLDEAKKQEAGINQQITQELQ
jgi:inosine-uridine nucleoside N-ribohydrolase/lysophospholipase L1-like esterase